MLNMGLPMEFVSAGKAGAGAQPFSSHGGEEGGGLTAGSGFERLLSGSEQGPAGEGRSAQNGETSPGSATPDVSDAGPDIDLTIDMSPLDGAPEMTSAPGRPADEEFSAPLALQDVVPAKPEAGTLRDDKVEATAPVSVEVPRAETAASHMGTGSARPDAPTAPPADTPQAAGAGGDDGEEIAGDVAPPDMVISAASVASPMRPAASGAVPDGMDIPGLKPVALGLEAGRKTIAAASLAGDPLQPAAMAGTVTSGAGAAMPEAIDAAGGIQPVPVRQAAPQGATTAPLDVPMPAAVEGERDVMPDGRGVIGPQADATPSDVSEGLLHVARPSGKAALAALEPAAPSDAPTNTLEIVHAAARGSAPSFSVAEATTQLRPDGFEGAESAMQRLGLELAAVAEKSARSARGSASRAARADHQLLGSVGVAMKSASIDDTGKTTLKLRPQGLGLIEIELSRDQGNRIHMSMRVQNPMVLDAIQSDRQLINGILESSGRGLSGFDLSGFDRGSRDDAPSRGAPSHGEAAGPDSMTGADMPVAAEAAQSNHLSGPDRVDILI